MSKKKVNLSYRVVCIAMMLNVFVMQGMKQLEDFFSTLLNLKTQQYNSTYYPSTNLPNDVLLTIFSYLTFDSQISFISLIPLEKTIATLMRTREVCKQFNKVLTIEVMGGFCKNYHLYDKEMIFKKLMHSFHFRYYERRLPALILIYAGVNARFYRFCHYFPQEAISHQDEEAVKIILNHDKGPTEKYDHYWPNFNSMADIPLFFFAKTKKMVQLCIDNGVNVHEVSGYNENVLWRVIQSNCYSLEILELYLYHKVDTTILSSINSSCLLHDAARWHYKHKNLVKKVTLLINAMPKEMINTLNKDNQTPLDVAQASIEKLKEMKATVSSKVLIQITDLIKLYKAHGGVTASELSRRVLTYDNSYTQKPNEAKKGNSEQKSGKK